MTTTTQTAAPYALDAGRRRYRLRWARWASAVRRRGSFVGHDTERGDVPGWVLVTLMTAGLVLALWALAGPALTAVFSDSIARVTGAIGG